MKVSVIIPSLNPDEKLVKVVDSLICEGVDDIILVNDGSDKEHMWPFESIAEYPQCTILTHEENRGKGRALKTAFDYCIEHRQGIDGVVTVDGDNQHRAVDILHCSKVMMEHRDKVVLGVRNFSGNNVPFKSRFGNQMTRVIFKFVCGLNISDTQTGLRAIPFCYLERFAQVTGERFEYETNMLLEFRQSHIDFIEVPIETVYIDENASTHFHPIRDSLKIYGVIFKFLFSSMTSSVIDLAVFTIVGAILYGRMENAHRILIATICARVISSFCNYSFNRKAVFTSTNEVGNSLARYYILCVLQLCVSYLLVYSATSLLNLGQVLTVIAKALTDILLFLVSYQIQKRWVFAHKL